MDNEKVYLNNLLNDNDNVVVAVSGGPDSMVLLDLLLKVTKKINIIVAHVNHNVRKEAIEEENYVKEFSKLNNLVFESMKIDKISDDNFENEARVIRYNFFDNLCKKYSAKYLFTAHHGDDLVETILMRIVRGSTIKGYSGFSKSVIKENYTIVRPLITVNKDQILAYAKKNNIKYYIDKTNMMDIHTRNRYRKYILPFLKSENKNVHQKFLKLSATLLEYNDYIDKEVKEKIKNIYVDNKLIINNFLKEEHIIQNKILYSILEKIYLDDLFILSDMHVNLIIGLMNSKKPQGKVHLPNNVIALKSYEYLSFESTDNVYDKYEVEINDKVLLNNGYNIEVLKDDVIDNSNNIIRLNTKEVSLPLYVRTRRNGDKIEVKGMKGHKKVNDIFIDNKIKVADRDVWPIVLDSKEEIVWIPGLKKSKYDKAKTNDYDYILKYYEN